MWVWVWVSVWVLCLKANVLTVWSANSCCSLNCFLLVQEKMSTEIEDKHLEPFKTALWHFQDNQACDCFSSSSFLLYFPKISAHSVLGKNPNWSFPINSLRTSVSRDPSMCEHSCACQSDVMDVSGWGCAPQEGSLMQKKERWIGSQTNLGSPKSAAY